MTFTPGYHPAPIPPRKEKQPKQKPPRTPLKKANKARKAKAFVTDFGGKIYHEYLTSLPCDICKVEGFTVAAHLTSRGAGGKADVLAPLCSTRLKVEAGCAGHGCHERYDKHDPQIRAHEPRLRELAKARRTAFEAGAALAA